MSNRTRLLRGIAVVAAVALVPIGGVANAVVDTTPPGPVSDVKVFTHVGALTMTWALPADIDLAKTVIRMKLGLTAPTSVTDGFAIVTTPTPGNVTWIDGLDPGTDFTFSLFAVDNAPTPNASSPVSVTIRGSDLTLTSSKSTLTYFGKTTFTAKVLKATSGAPLASEAVYFYVRPRGSRTWYFLDKKTTNSSGVATKTWDPGVNIDVQAYFYGSLGFLGASGGVARVNVAPKVIASTNFSARKQGMTFTFRGSVTPKFAGKWVFLERYYSGAWHFTKSTKLTSTSGFAFSVKSAKKGKYGYRVRKAADSAHVTAYSATLWIKVT